MSGWRGLGAGKEQRSSWLPDVRRINRFLDAILFDVRLIFSSSYSSPPKEIALNGGLFGVTGYCVTDASASEKRRGSC